MGKREDGDVEKKEWRGERFRLEMKISGADLEKRAEAWKQVGETRS